MSADAIGLDMNNPAPGTADFHLSPEELAKGESAATTYVESLKGADGRRSAEEALDTLAAVISGGLCGGLSFPWHQVRAYHEALALSIVKEEGAPANIEALRCRHNANRKYQAAPDSFPSKQLRRMRVSLRGVMATCVNLGYLSEDGIHPAIVPSKTGAKDNGRSNGKEKSSPKGAAKGRAKERVLTLGEVRALIASCNLKGSSTSLRNALMISLAYHHALRTVDLVNLTLGDLHFERRTGRVTVSIKQPQGKRAKRFPLENDELIALEDWLEIRGRANGPLFCPLGRGQQPELKRMSAAEMRELCDAAAETAGVVPFAPNDLARSGAANSDASKRRLAAERAAAQPLAGSSALYDGLDPGADQGEAATEQIQFPYDPFTTR